MDCDDAIEIGNWVVFDGSHWAVLACVIYQNADSPEFFTSSGNDMSACGVLRQICRRIFGLPAALRDFSRDRGKFLLRARGQKYRRAFFREQFRDGPADASA